MAMNYAANLAKEAESTLDVKCLFSVLEANKRPAATLADPNNRPSLSRQAVEVSLQVEAGGVKNWKRLSKESRKVLVDAELLWMGSAASLGRDIEDWGGIAASFIKWIEIELRTRLEPVITSEAYQAWKPSSTHQWAKVQRGAASFARLLFLFEHYESLPEPLRDEMSDTGMRLPFGADLVRSLQELRRDVRNVASHEGNVDSRLMAHLRMRLFQKPEELLKKFVESLGDGPVDQ